MVRVRLPGINTVRKTLADGSVRLYYYHRATGRALGGKPGLPEFRQAYDDAERLMRDRLAGTFNGLIRDYTLSPEFGRLKESTQRQYRRMLTAAEAKFGDMPLAALEDPRVRKDFTDWRVLVAEESGAREADNRLGVVSAMLSWGREAHQLSSNHLAGFRRLYTNDRSEIIWLPEHITAFMRAASVPMQRALILALHTGQRQGDLLRLAWGNYDGEFISLRQGKTGRKVVLPATPALKRMLDEIDRKATVILTTPTGRPWTGNNFRDQWLATCRRAELPPNLHFHDLRGTTITLLARSGATVPMIASVTGHSLKQASSILEKYLPRTKELAGEAIILFENAKGTRFANQLQTTPRDKRKGITK